jgi:hypothetical protein
VIVAANGRFVICSAAALLEPGDKLQAWAERHVRQDPDIRWVLGNYVEANQANSNGHIFPLDDLVTAQATLEAKPLNMMHREHYIVGAFAGAQLLNSDGTEYNHAEARQLAAAASTSTTVMLPTHPPQHTTWNSTNAVLAQAQQPPYVEALAALWHTRFPEEYYNIRRAHADGTLFFSMEAIPEEVSCPTCAHRAAYAGVEHDTYCTHMQGAVGPKQLHKPTFNGGAIIIPPVKPGWSRADITAISKLVTERPDEADGFYEQAKETAPHLDTTAWEQMMATLLLQAKEFPAKEREKKAKSGEAMDDGSFPISNQKDLRNAIQSIGRAKNPGAAKTHIKKRAKDLGLSYLIPKGW